MPRLNRQPPPPEQSCRLCKSEDNSRMVCCDDCHRWYHFDCVAVTESVADHDWSCQECVAANIHSSQPAVTAPSVQILTSTDIFPGVNVAIPSSVMAAAVTTAPVGNPILRNTPSKQVPSSVTSGQSDVNVVVSPRVQILGSNDEKCSGSMLPGTIPPVSFGPSQSGTIPPGFSGPSGTIFPGYSHLPGVDVVPSNQPKQHVQLSADLQLKLLQEEEAIERKFLQRKYQLMTSSANPSANQPAIDVSFHQPVFHSSPLQPVFPTAPQQHLLYNGTGVNNETALLNSSQIAARHAVAKELPVYHGEPEEWPLFFATYENTTRLCGYTPEENMVRLQRCLRGKALDAVRSQLLHPSNLDRVLSTLKMLFGRPEIIVHTLIEKINRIPAPKVDKLNTLVDFALAVRNMVATIQACHLEEHLYNITLLQELVERLPPMVRLNWATHRLQLHKVTLLEFSDWLYALAEAASTVTMPSPFAASDNKPRRGRKEDGFLHVHSESSPEESLSERTRTGCVVCQGKCAIVEKCNKFLSLELSNRWDAVRKFKLCRTCLGLHRGQCRSGKVCGKDNCGYKHHHLLHNVNKDKLKATTQPARTEPKTESAATNAAPFNCSTHRANESSVLFQYVPVTLHHQGKAVHTYAFVDGGSQMTLLEDSLAAELELRGENHTLCIRWTTDHCCFVDSAERVTF